MELHLMRRGFTGTSTEGDLFVNDEFFCFTLEDFARKPGDEKVWGRTAIPEGRYQVVVDWSPRFQCEMPRLLDVPGFEGIRIHAGNRPEDSSGCILVGDDQTTLHDAWLGKSRPAYNRLTRKLQAAQNRGEEIWIDIESYVPPRQMHKAGEG